MKFSNETSSGLPARLARGEVLGEDALVVVGLATPARARRDPDPAAAPVIALVELDAALDDRVAVVVELLLAGLGAAEQAREHHVEAVREAVELGADRAERAIEVAVDDVGDAELDLIDLRDQPAMRQVEAEQRDRERAARRAAG